MMVMLWLFSTLVWTQAIDWPTMLNGIRDPLPPLVRTNYLFSRCILLFPEVDPQKKLTHLATIASQIELGSSVQDIIWTSIADKTDLVSCIRDACDHSLDD